MPGLKGLSRTPQANVRARRNTDNLAFIAQFATGVISLDDSGVLTIETDDTLSINGSDELGAVLQGVLGSDSSGIKLNIGEGVENDGAGNLRVKVQGVIGRDGSGIKLVFGTGLQNDAGTLKVLETDLSFIDASGDIVVPGYDNAGRPAAGTAGRVIWNTDDVNMNFDTGAAWILPDGTVT
jgi:hypothetical protein